MLLALACVTTLFVMTGCSDMFLEEDVIRIINEMIQENFGPEETKCTKVDLHETADGWKGTAYFSNGTSAKCTVTDRLYEYYVEIDITALSAALYGNSQKGYEKIAVRTVNEIIEENCGYGKAKCTKVQLNQVNDRKWSGTAFFSNGRSAGCEVSNKEDQVLVEIDTDDLDWL